VVNIAANFTQN